MCIYCNMTKQLFKTIINPTELTQLLDKICSKSENYYVMNNAAYKRGIFTGDIVKFIEFCIPHYHVSKRHYLERKTSYKNFVTIIRQICNSNNIAYIPKIVYDKSTYEILYYIYAKSSLV